MDLNDLSVEAAGGAVRVSYGVLGSVEADPDDAAAFAQQVLKACQEAERCD